VPGRVPKVAPVEGEPKVAHGVLPDNYRVSGLKYYLAAGFVVGLVVLVGSPLAMRCPDNPLCHPSSRIIGTSIATVYPGGGKAFEDLIAQSKLVSRARQQPGNIGYELVRDSANPDSYQFIEHWYTIEQLQTWIQGYPQTLFRDPAMINLLVGGKLHDLTGHVNLLPATCSKVETGLIHFDVNATCNTVWKVVSDWSNCKWVIGCEYAVVDNLDPKLRQLQFGNAPTVDVILREMDGAAKTLTYEILRPLPGYFGHLKLIDTPGSSGCTGSYTFTNPRGSNRTAAVYADFLNVRVPGLKILFA